MAYKISDIPTHDATPAGTSKIESEQDGGTSVWSTLAELFASLSQGSPALDATSQLQGFTAANLVEVEDGTEAMRVVLRTGDLGAGQDQGFTVSRHMMGMQWTNSLTTAGSNQVINAAGMWPVGGGIALLNKFSASMVTSALSGTRVGVARLTLLRACPIVSMGITNNWRVPPIGSPSFLSSDYASMRSGQQLPNFIIAATSTPTSLQEVRSLGEAVGKATSTLGETNVPPTLLFDALGTGKYQPYIMTPNMGWLMVYSIPAATTSQTLAFSITTQWDEWVPDGGDR